MKNRFVMLNLKFGIFCIVFLFCLVNPTGSLSIEKNITKESSKVSSTDVVRVKFGSGPDDIGIITPEEANPEGPISFALGSKGEIYILDQVNQRVQVFKEGKRINTIPILSNTFIDIALIQNGKIALLDNLVKKSVYILDSKGKILNIVPLEGRLIPNAAEVTKVMYIKNGKFAGIWVSVGDRSIRIAMADGSSHAERISVPGLFSSDGTRLIRAEKFGDATAVIYRSKKESFSQWEPEITVFFNMYIIHLFGIWDDKSGRLYLRATLEDKNNKLLNTIVILNLEGKELKRVNLFVQKMPHEIHRSIRVSSDGHIFQMALDKKGVFVRRYRIFNTSLSLLNNY